VGTYAAAQILRLVPRVRVSRAVGRLCEAKLPQGLSNLVSSVYARAYRVNLDEVEPEPSGAYATFDAFFTRQLRAGARPIADASLVSPADGQLLATGAVLEGMQIQVKGQSYDVAELLGDRHDAARYAGGSFAVVFLSPRV
jgi:phosphatidylserine decarboxylase